MKFRFFFDYIYFRLTEFYYRFDEKVGSTAIAIVALIQGLIIGNIFMLIRLMIGESIIGKYSKLIGYISFGLVLVLYAYNFSKYHDKFDILKEHWSKMEDKDRKVKDVIIFFIIVCLIGLLVFFNIYI